MSWWQVALVLFLTPIAKDLVWPCEKYDHANFLFGMACWAAALILTLVKLPL